MKAVLVTIIIGLVLFFGFLITNQKSLPQENTDVPANNVSIVNGKQIIEINARGGYQPNSSVAKAGIPTILRFNTAGTFDCSSAVRIPSMNISKLLPQTGSTDIDLGIQQVSTLVGTCGMGMYPFEVEFES